MSLTIKSPVMAVIILSFLVSACGVSRPDKEDPNASKVKVSEKSKSDDKSSSGGTSKDKEAQESETHVSNSELPTEKEDLEATIAAQSQSANDRLKALADSGLLDDPMAHSSENLAVSTAGVAEKESGAASVEDLNNSQVNLAEQSDKNQKDKNMCTEYMINDEISDGTKLLSMLELLAFLGKNRESKFIHLSSIKVQAEEVAITDGVLESVAVLDFNKPKDLSLRSQLICSHLNEDKLLQVTLTSTSALSLDDFSYDSVDLISGTFQHQTQVFEISESVKLETKEVINSPESLQKFIGISEDDKVNGTEVEHKIVQLNEKEIQIRVTIKDPVSEGSLVQQVRKIHYTYSL